MPSTSHVRHPALLVMDRSAWNPAESVASRERNAYDRKSLGAHSTSPSSACSRRKIV